MDDVWTIAELAELAAQALASPGTPGPDARANGRVRDVPNERLIRWYGTVGLVDPPLSRRGRVARYGRRHLLQLVAVKRRQAEGRSLAQIQAELAGATDEVLAAVARVPALGPAPTQAGACGPAADAERLERPDRFWARQPPPLVAAASAAGTESADTDVPSADVPGTGLVRGIRLAPGVVLLLEGADREPGPEDLTAIVNAARPLLRELASRGLGARGPRYPADNGPSPDGSPT